MCRKTCCNSNEVQSDTRRCCSPLRHVYPAHHLPRQPSPRHHSATFEFFAKEAGYYFPLSLNFHTNHFFFGQYRTFCHFYLPSAASSFNLRSRPNTRNTHTPLTFYELAFSSGIKRKRPRRFYSFHSCRCFRLCCLEEISCLSSCTFPFSHGGKVWNCWQN